MCGHEYVLIMTLDDGNATAASRITPNHDIDLEKTYSFVTNSSYFVNL